MSRLVTIGPPFDKPLTFGDPDQITAIQIMNGEDLYCTACWSTFDDSWNKSGRWCPECEGARLRWGAGHYKAKAS
ncbi:MAG TPA: hypothetical protein VNA25_09490 [Phycisphaerae bacterium]|nr:hypothetical protein [Phycisphaerae bacterium]